MNNAPYVLTSTMRQVTSTAEKLLNQPFEVPKDRSLITKSKKSRRLTRDLGTS